MITSDIVPSIPSIGDAAILFTLWENFTQDNTEIKAPRWQALEKLGDISIKMIWQDVVSTLFGEKNNDLNKIVWDHANSNILFEVISNCYDLKKRVRGTTKNWKYTADIFEAWIGGHIYERRQYDYFDPLLELRHYLKTLWTIRYRKLLKYAYNPSISPACIPSTEGQVKIVHVKDAKDEILAEVLGGYLDGLTNLPDKGFGYFITVALPERVCYSFSTSKSEAQKMASFRMWTAERNSTALMSNRRIPRSSAYGRDIIPEISDQVR